MGCNQYSSFLPYWRIDIFLLNYFNIKKPLFAAHKFNEEKAVLKIIEDLKEGKNIALVSDRGTPLISDPGNVCVKRVLENGFDPKKPLYALSGLG